MTLLHTCLCFAGIPVWVGRKLYSRYENDNRHKRNLVIAGGVTASVSYFFLAYKKELTPILCGKVCAIIVAPLVS